MPPEGCAASITLPAKIERLDALVAFVRHECERHRVAAEDRLSIELICDELASNICRHAYRQKEGEFECLIRFDGDTCVVRFVDRGRPFDPTRWGAPDLEVPVEDRRIGGLGISLVRRHADRLEYRRDRARNVVTVYRRVKRLGPRS